MDLYQWLTLLAIALSPLAMGWFPCSNCGACPVACSTCVDGRAPERIQIEVAGLEDFHCTTCVDYDRTYIATWTFSSPPNPCRWLLIEEMRSCDTNVHVEVLLSRSGPKRLIATVSAGVTSPFNQVVGSWSKELSGDEFECTVWDDLELPLPGGPDTCDPTNATCYVTSL